MILTITLNPSVDINYKLDELSIDNVNRTENVGKTAGGKGLNVASVLAQLGEIVSASGFLGGSLGDFIRKEIAKIGIQDLFVEISEDTRNCIAIIHDGKQTEILENGPTIKEEEGNLFLQKFTETVKKSIVITISGSLPKGIDEEYYNRLLEIANHFNKPVFLDTKGSLLLKTLVNKVKPYLIKPNQQELEDLLDIKFRNDEDIYAALQDDLFDGVEWVVITLGADGAIVKNRNHMYHARIPKIEAVNPVGSGDSVIAGFAAGFSQGLTDEAFIKYGLAMGTLNAMEEKTGNINSDKIDWCLDSIYVEKIEYVKTS